MHMIFNWRSVWIIETQNVKITFLFVSDFDFAYICCWKFNSFCLKLNKVGESVIALFCLFCMRMAQNWPI